MSRVVLLDGGMGQELVRRAKTEDHPMWSAKVLLERPELVEQAHRDFIDAGATVITLNAYATTPERLSRDGAPELFEPLQRRAREIAERAREGAPHEVRIAGCLPPLFGSYHPEAAPPFEEAVTRYAEIIAQQPSVDLFLCETMSSTHEAKAAITAARETGKPAWCAFSLDDDGTAQLRSGEPLADALEAIGDRGHEATLLNCSRPETFDPAMPILATRGAPFGAYANGFTSVAPLELGGTVDRLEARHDLDPPTYAEHAMRWVDAGARIVGGCCEVGPAHIAAVRDALRRAGHEIVGSIDLD